MTTLSAIIPISLTINNPYQEVGKPGKFRIIGAPPGGVIYWSSYKDGQATGELNASYGQTIEANGTAELEVTWAADQIGEWTKEILVQDAAGTNYTAMVRFIVLPANAGAAGAVVPGQSWFEKGFDVAGYTVPYWLAIGAAWFVFRKK